jgi:hypothetical protein
MNFTFFEPCIVIYLCTKNPVIDQNAYMDALKKYHKTARKSRPEEEYFDVWNMSKTL